MRSWRAAVRILMFGVRLGSLRRRNRTENLWTVVSMFFHLMLLVGSGMFYWRLFYGVGIKNRNPVR